MNRLTNSKCGVWIDQKEAFIVTFKDDATCDIEHIESDVESRHRSTGGSRGKQHYVHRSVNSAARQDRRRRNELREHYQQILNRLQERKMIDSIYILGSGQAKDEFSHFIQEHAQESLNILGVKATKRLSEAQLVDLFKKTMVIERVTALPS